jgi:hypothetical protein
MIQFRIILMFSVLYIVSLSGCVSHSQALLLYKGPVDLILDENCTMVGRVINKDTRKPIIGAIIFFENTNIGGICDNDGNYSIGRIPPGNHNLKVSCIGFELLKISNFNFEKSHYYLVDFELVKEPPVLPE